MTKREQRMSVEAPCEILTEPWQCFGRTLRIVLRKHRLAAKKRIRTIIKRNRQKQWEALAA